MKLATLKTDHIAPTLQAALDQRVVPAGERIVQAT